MNFNELLEAERQKLDEASIIGVLGTIAAIAIGMKLVFSVLERRRFERKENLSDADVKKIVRKFDSKVRDNKRVLAKSKREPKSDERDMKIKKTQDEIQKLLVGKKNIIKKKSLK